MIQCDQLKQSENLVQANSEKQVALYCHGEVVVNCQFKWIAGMIFKIGSPNFGEVFDPASEPPAPCSNSVRAIRVDSVTLSKLGRRNTPQK